MRPADFTFDLPESQIALFPAPSRDGARLMHVERGSGRRAHKNFRDLPDLLRAGDLLVMNDTRVLPARLFAKGEDGKNFELLLLKEKAPLLWSCLAKPGKKVGNPTKLIFSDGEKAELRRVGDREFEARFTTIEAGEFLAWLGRNGKMPLPPYLKRAAEDSDRDRYQTVFADRPKSVAAPTAGLHFTPEMLSLLEAKGVRTAKVTLEIGYGTFAPIDVEDLAEHRMHEETYRIPPETLAELDAARADGRRVISVGTTTLRALESLDEWGAEASTNIFIRPGHAFRRVDGLITNFHLPESTLLILVCAFLGTEATLPAYREAVREGYRFFSYGDAMAILP